MRLPRLVREALHRRKLVPIDQAEIEAAKASIEAGEHTTKIPAIYLDGVQVAGTDSPISEEYREMIARMTREGRID